MSGLYPIESPTQIVDLSQSQSQDGYDSSDFTQRSSKRMCEHSETLQTGLSSSSIKPSSKSVGKSKQTEKRLVEMRKKHKKQKKIKVKTTKKVKEAAAELCDLGKKQCTIKQFTTPTVQASSTRTTTTSRSRVEHVTRVNAVNAFAPAFATPSPSLAAAFHTSPSLANAPRTTTSDCNTDINTHICTGCGYGLKDCHEKKYRVYCLHGVMDYFDDVGFHYSDDLGVYTAYSKAYSAAVKKDTLESFTLYERTREVEIPLCMMKGSLRDAQYIRYCNLLYQYLLETRVYDVQRHAEENDGNLEELAFPKWH